LNEDVEILPPTYDEVSNIIRKLKSNKGPGPDNIVSELIKEGGQKLKHRIHTLISKIWEKEELPVDWENNIICTIYKKGDRMQCKNYRPIALLNVAYKIFATTHCKKLTEIVEGKLGEYQMGFRPDRSTIHNIFILRQIYEKCHEYNIELHNVFIDFNQAFDSINRSTVTKVLKGMQIPGKIIRLVTLLTQHTKAKIKLNSEYTEQLEVKTGIRQGDSLSTILFCTVMESFMKKLEMRGNISMRLKQVCVYADDIVMVTRTEQALINTFQKLKQEAIKYGLVINQNKTKYMWHSRVQTNVKNKEIEIEGMKIEEVNSAKYLGKIMNADNLIEE